MGTAPTLPNPFTPGPSTVDAPPAGEVERQAVNSLRGYVYQTAVSALAWLETDDRGRIFLEVAEDYAVVAQQSLNATQVKDTAASGSITLNSTAAIDAVHSFVQLTEENDRSDVHLRFLTTSTVSAERKKADRPGGQAGIIYWRQAAAGADVAPLRKLLSSNKFSSRVRDFVSKRDDVALRRELLQRIHWDCGQPDLAGVIDELQARLVILGRDTFGLPAPEAQRLVAPIIYRVLNKCVLKESSDRVLTRAELYATIDEATRISVPRRVAVSTLDIEATAAAALRESGAQSAAFSSTEPTWLVPGDDLAIPRGIISRTNLVNRIKNTLSECGCVVLTGGSGLGKTLVAREVASALSGGFILADMRDVEAREAAHRLLFTLRQMGASSFDSIIFDDFNQFEDREACACLVRCMQSLRRRDRSAFITSYRRPSQKVLTDLGLKASVVIEIPYLSQDEVKEVVVVSNGDPELWGQIAFAAGAQGHPQLVHAFVSGMAARGWPSSEVGALIVRGFASHDTDAERDAARRSMVATLSEDARTLLYRLSLVIGRFDRAFALQIAEIPPPIQRTGELLDSLTGPWIEIVSKDFLRVSPLAANAGKGMLTPAEQQSAHAAISAQMLSGHDIDALETNAILAHALLGKNVGSLFRLAYSVISADTQTLEFLREHFFMLSMLRTDQPIFAENLAVSAFLRLAQFKLNSKKGSKADTSACVDALLLDVDSVPDARQRQVITSMALSTIVGTQGIGSLVPRWIELLQRFRKLTESEDTAREIKDQGEKAAKELGRSFYGMIFGGGISDMQSVKRLEEIFDDLDQLDKSDRAFWLQDFEMYPADYSLLVNPAWAAETARNQLDTTDAIERYQRMARRAQQWGYPALAIQCYIARAVIFDEYMNDAFSALTALDRAVSYFGDDVALTRARARIFWRNGKHQESVETLRAVADLVGRENSVERAFAMREAAISAANIGDWRQAEEWFGEAEKAAALVETADMQTMAVGLEADRSVALLESQRTAESLKAMSSCLMRLSKINPGSSLGAEYCHRVVRHAVLWMQSQVEGDEKFGGEEPIGMLPGSCSNPQPPASIVDLPLGHLDVAWYMLAEIEASTASDVGIADGLRSNLEGGPIPLLEGSLCHRRIISDILNLNGAGFARHLLGYLASSKHLSESRQVLRETFNAIEPPRGETPSLSTVDQNDPSVVGAATDAVLAFEIVAALRGVSGAAFELRDRCAEVFGDDYPGKVAVDRLVGIDAQLAPLDAAVASGIMLLRSGGHLEPRVLWEVGLRLFEKIQLSNFRKFLTPLLAEWLTAVWERIAVEESFRLDRPLQTVPAIKSFLGGRSMRDAAIASLLLATAEAVGSPLTSEYESRLRQISRDEAL